jgi:hypothetical protein
LGFHSRQAEYRGGSQSPAQVSRRSVQEYICMLTTSPLFCRDPISHCDVDGVHAAGKPTVVSRSAFASRSPNTD